MAEVARCAVDTLEMPLDMLCTVSSTGCSRRRWLLLARIDATTRVWTDEPFELTLRLAHRSSDGRNDNRGACCVWLVWLATSVARGTARVGEEWKAAAVATSSVSAHANVT